MLRLQTRLTVVILGMFATLTASGVVGAVTIWQVSRILHVQVEENVPSMRASTEVKLAMLEQRGNVVAYILDDGNEAWIDRLEVKKQAFAHWLEITIKSARKAEEVRILHELERAYDVYDDRREEAIRRFDQGDVAKATEIVLEELPGLYDSAKDACDRLLDANTHYMQHSVQAAYRQAFTMGWVTVSCLCVGLVLAISMVGMLALGIFRPLRETAAEARQLASIDDSRATSRAGNDLQTLPQSLRAIAGTLTTTRANLQESREELQQALKLAAVGRIAAEVAHEIRSLLSTMNLCMYANENNGLMPLRESLAAVHAEVHRLERNFTEFLNFARSPAPQITVCVVSQLIKSSVDLICPRMTEKQLTLHLDLAAGLPDIYVDSNQISQILVNLLTNACDAAPPASQLTLAANTERHADGRQIVVIRVCNPGPEIPEAVRERIFNPYFTTKSSGIGLGLAICESIAQLHDGQLRLESSSATETVFALRLAEPQEALRERNSG